ncbi:hypothetical protein T11_1627 [Trichinella zimbabwensis]|uniref:Uncharacterized protein n=1 Tax=Trichinella zimbabwensis TaxID=268475 RepID=A0A0V1H071_9BILA|nr:hypothetical protein T11_1627 [Trichinella zimbabwensis]
MSKRGAQNARKHAKKHISYLLVAWTGFLDRSRYWTSSSSSLHERRRSESSLPNAKKEIVKNSQNQSYLDVNDSDKLFTTERKLIKKKNLREMPAEVQTKVLTNQAQNHRYKRSNLNKCSVQFKKLKNIDNKDEKLLMRKTQQC